NQGDDEYLSRDDIRAAARDPSVTGRSAAALAVLVDRMDDIVGLSDDERLWESEIHRGDLAAIERMAASGNADDAATARSFANGMNAAERRIRNTNRDLFADPAAGPDLNSIRQGRIGDCWVLATVGSICAHDPQAIANMITERDDGRFRVNFPGGRTVTVPAPTDTELGFLGTAGSDGLWLPVLEKAVGEHYQQGYFFSTTELDHEPIGDGGQTADAIELLTGRDTTGFDPTRGRRRANDTVFFNRVADAFDADCVMVASRRRGGDGSTLAKRHAYSVIDVDREARTITIRNPWGSGDHMVNGRPRDGRNDGVMVLSIPEFRNWMDWLVIQDRE
ncbi:MAG: C2 family cysteine protease, partial [Myxococcota bacterium]